MSRFTSSLALVTVLISLAISHAHAARFYKWIDDEGNINYSDKAPDESVETEEVHLRSSQSSASSPKPPEFNPQSNSEPQEEAKKEENIAELKAYCDGIKANIKSLEIGGRIQTVDSEGNRKYLDENEQSAQMEKYKKEYSSRCNF